MNKVKRPFVELHFADDCSHNPYFLIDILANKSIDDLYFVISKAHFIRLTNDVENLAMIKFLSNSSTFYSTYFEKNDLIKNYYDL